ncbi:ribonuclease H-like domain-containing protein [Spinellus fusiger]|nr:ribonuclease H-like domain-containing protein [Spinellus fusiger]
MKQPKATPSSNWKKIQSTLPPATPTTIKKPYIKRAPKNKTEVQTTTTTTTTKTTPPPLPDVSTEDLWFADDVDEKDLALAYGSSKEHRKLRSHEERARKKKMVQDMDAVQGKEALLGKFVAIDCEMVGVGPQGSESALARVSLVNFHGAVLMDAYVRPQEKVTDFRTHVSGIEAKHFEKALSFQEAQQQVADLIKGRVLIGHAVHNDLKALMLDHPALFLRDTSRYKPFRKLASGRTPGLKTLVQKILEITIQSGSHSSVEDARFTMLLYKKVKDEWEKSFGSRTVARTKKLAAQEQSRTLKNKTTPKEASVAAGKKSSHSSHSSDSSGSESESEDDEAME